MTTPITRAVRREVIIGSRTPTAYIVTIDRAGVTLRPKGRRTPLDVLPWGSIEILAADRTARRVAAERKAARLARRASNRSR